MAQPWGSTSANSLGITSYTLTIGTSQKLYAALTTTGAQATFGIPPQSSITRGRIIFQMVLTSGSLTTATANLEISLDGGTTWQPFVTGIDLWATSAGTAQSVEVSGLGGLGNMRLNFTTVTGSTPVFDVWAHTG